MKPNTKNEMSGPKIIENVNWVKSKLEELEEAENQFLFVQNQYGNLEQSEGEWGASCAWESAEDEVWKLRKEIASLRINKAKTEKQGATNYRDETVSFESIIS